MKGRDFREIVQLIVKDDKRYDRDAYFFLRDGLDFTVSRIRKANPEAPPRHVSGRELCEGLRDYALDRYGPMTQDLLREWGLRETLDFGNLVFHLIDYRVFSKTEEDRLEDFREVYSFEEAFVMPFEPRQKQAQPMPIEEENA